MHCLINGWFLHQLNTGSGQYLHQLLTQLTQPSSGQAMDFTLLVPISQKQQTQADLWPGVVCQPVTLPALPRNLQKLWWEQVTVPWAAQRLHADLLWAPYWAAPLWQPCPTVVTVHDIIHYLLPGGAPPTAVHRVGDCYRTAGGSRRHRQLCGCP